MIVFTGDICLSDKAFDIGFGVGSMLAKGEVKPFEGLLKEEGEVWIGNFEGVVSNVSCHNDNTRDSFRIPSDTYAKCGSFIDYWGIANNHVMEHGGEAYRQMEQILSAKSKGVFGSDTQRTICFNHQGKKIAVTGLSLRVEEEKHQPLYWHIPELKDIQRECEHYVDADFRIVYIHWGVEYVNYPDLEQVRLAHWLIDIGYDLIIGMHPHILQGFELYKGKYIYYSLGNCIFNMNYAPSKYGAIVALDVTTGEVRSRYIQINGICCPNYVNENDVPEPYRFASLNKKLSTERNIEKYISDFHRGLKLYRKSNNRYIMKNLYHYRFGVIFQILSSFIKRRLK